MVRKSTFLWCILSEGQRCFIFVWQILFKHRTSKVEILHSKKTDGYLNFSVSLIRCKRKCYQVGVLVWTHQANRKTFYHYGKIFFYKVSSSRGIDLKST